MTKIYIAVGGSYPEDAIEIVDNIDNIIYYYNLGGGFQRQMPLKKFNLYFKPWDEVPNALRSGHFAIDDGVKYPGYTYGHKWNGWACPYFKKEIADLIMAEVNQSAEDSGYSMWYDDTQDAYCYGEDGEEPDIYSAVEDLYPIGNGYWTWEE